MGALRQVLALTSLVCVVPGTIALVVGLTTGGDAGFGSFELGAFAFPNAAVAAGFALFLGAAVVLWLGSRIPDDAGRAGFDRRLTHSHLGSVRR